MSSSQQKLDQKSLVLNPEKFIYTQYLERPDYTRPLLEVPPEARERMRGRLEFLYGSQQAGKWLPELERLLKVHQAHKPAEMLQWQKDFSPDDRLTEKDMVLITYGDLVAGDNGSPLQFLGEMLEGTNLRQTFSTLHLLPFFPYSSDKGFSVIDFREVDPNLGTWQDIKELGKQYHLLFDGVFNHVSAQSEAFRSFLDGDPTYADMVISYDSPEKLSEAERRLVLRPRTSDLLTEFQSLNGPIWVWTTFSPDQVDLNFKNPLVLLYVLETLLIYVRRGAEIVRLDAVTYLWEEPGTPCANLEQTHQIIKLLRDALDLVAPWVMLLTETNIPHADNIAYFGDGHDEAQMVYNFALPPLVLFTMQSGDAGALSRWADGLEYPSQHTTYLNILDTHDGIGLLGARGFLSPAEINRMVDIARDYGALVSFRSGPSGEEPYEINSTWFSAVNDEQADEPQALQVKRFLASRSIALALKGVPAIYLHGLIGSSSDRQAAAASGCKRDVNREVISGRKILQQVADPDSRVSLIADLLFKLSNVRASQAAFHPGGAQKVLEFSPQVFALLRTSPDGGDHILCLTNVANESVSLHIDLSEVGVGARAWRGLIDGREFEAQQDRIVVGLEPYEVAWLMPTAELEDSADSAASSSPVGGG